MMKLYFNKFTRASRVRWMLEELGVPYECVMVDMRAGEHRDPSKNPHPLGKLPALVDDDGTVLFESSAIVVHLADRYAGHGFIPAAGQRGRFYTWAFYAQVTLEPEVYTVFTHTQRLPENERDPALAAAARERFTTLLAPIAAELRRSPHLLGDSFTAADLLIAAVLIWARGMGMLEGQAELLAYCERLAARPARLRSLA